MDNVILNVHFVTTSNVNNGETNRIWKQKP